jgi:hypothetical protein
MILIASAEKRPPYTPKGVISRVKTLEMYEAEVDQLYVLELPLNRLRYHILICSTDMCKLRMPSKVLQFQAQQAGHTTTSYNGLSRKSVK